MAARSWSNGLRGSEHFPSPFLDMASMVMPKDRKSAFELCEAVFYSNGTYRRAVEQIIAYFLTDVEVLGTGDEERIKYEEYLRDEVDILGHVQRVFRDRACYGNGMMSIMTPFRRFMRCPDCGSLQPLRVVYQQPEYEFSFQDFEFRGKCPNCKWHGNWDVYDMPSASNDPLIVKHWSPYEIDIIHDPYTGDSDYLWNIPATYKKQLRDGHLYHLERATLEVIKAVKNDSLFRINKGNLFHAKEQTLSGAGDASWGTSLVLTNLRQVWYVAMLKRYNEALVMDYIIPFRVITPAPRKSAAQGGAMADPLLNLNMGTELSEIRKMLAERRRDPASWHTLSFPVEYQAMGGDAKNLTPHDLLEQGQLELITNIGAPVDLFRQSFESGSTALGLRLFEVSWRHMAYEMNALVKWAVDKVALYKQWENVDARLQKVSRADEMQDIMARLQLMMGGQISGTSALRPMHLDYIEEQRRLAAEAQKVQELQAEQQEQMEQAAFGEQLAQGGAAGPAGAAPPGGGQPAPADPSAGGGAPPAGAAGQSPVQAAMSTGMPMSPDDMLAEADSLAQYLMTQPPSSRRTELSMLKQKNEVLHGLVTQRMKEIRQQMASAGQSAMLQQTFGTE